MKPSEGAIAAAEAGEPEWLEHLAVLRLQPNDLVVLRSPQRLSRAACEEMQNLVAERLTSFLAFTVRVVVLEDGMELGVIRGQPDA